MNMTKTIKISFSLCAGAILTLAFPLPASAHVSITPYSAAPGTYSLITFTVPNESATATTTRVEVDIPTATPFASVSYVPIAGWKTQLITTTLPKPIMIDHNELTQAVTQVIWTADAASALTGAQLQLFPLSVGTIPDTGEIMLSATQTYSDGSVVKWDESGADAEHPAPVLYVNTPPVASHDADAEVTAETTGAHSPASTSPATDTLARAFGVGGLALGAAALVLAVVTARRKAAN